MGSDNDALTEMRRKYTFLGSKISREHEDHDERANREVNVGGVNLDNSMRTDSALNHSIMSDLNSVFAKGHNISAIKHKKKPEAAVNISTIKKAVERPKFKFNNKINEKNVVNDLFREDSEASDNDSDDLRRKKQKKKSSKSRKGRRSENSRSRDSESQHSRQSHSHSRGRRVKEGDGRDRHGSINSRHSSSGKRAKEGNSPRQFSNSLKGKARELQNRGPQIMEEQTFRIPSNAIVDHQEIQIEDKTSKRKLHGKSSSSKRDKSELSSKNGKVRTS